MRVVTRFDTIFKKLITIVTVYFLIQSVLPERIGRSFGSGQDASLRRNLLCLGHGVLYGSVFTHVDHFRSEKSSG